MPSTQNLGDLFSFTEHMQSPAVGVNVTWAVSKLCNLLFTVSPQLQHEKTVCGGGLR